jgi:hypothetical protein
LSPGAGCTQGGATEAEYTVDIEADDFVARIDNPYFPFLPGAQYTYEGQTDEGLEHIEVVVLPETREVMGIMATAVRDTVTIDGVLVEDTIDWFAQDDEGNVWYLGEDVTNYKDGVAANKAGSWEAGVDGALPGIVMYADPSSHVGEAYRQEFYQGEAEDMGEILSTSEQISLPIGSFVDVVKTLDTTPLEPNLREHKYYAPGVGLIQEVDADTGQTIVLVEMNQP